MSILTPIEITEQLIQERPRVHGPRGDLDWAIEPTVLRWLAKNLDKKMKCLETGCGYSTIVFAAAGVDHTIISPIAEEHRAVSNLIESFGIVKKPNFICGKSDEVLPTLKTEKLDLALIDGWHGFPGPIVDWWYLATMMRPGGRIVVDDVDIRAVDVLCRFLQAERDTWSIEESFYKTKVFKIIALENLHFDWTQQEYCSKKMFRATKELRRVAGAALRSIKGI